MQNKIIDKKIFEYLALNQKNIAIMAAAVLVTFSIFFFIIYSPKSHSVRNLKKQYEELDSGIREIESLCQGKSLDETFAMFDKESKELDAKFPSSEETTLKLLSSYAEKAGVNVTSLSPEGIKVSSQESGISGLTLMGLGITIDLKGTYMTVGEYINILEGNFQTYVKINSLSMTKEKSEDKTNPEIRAHLVLTAYMLRQEDRSQGWEEN